jgi:DUF971 family protein
VVHSGTHAEKPEVVAWQRSEQSGEHDMSHEGIRIVSAEQAQREDLEHEEMSEELVTPKKVRVKKTEGTGMEIEWKDGHESAWTFRWLRNACPCATCHEEREKTGRLPGEEKPGEQTLLKMYKAPVTPIDVTPVGKYALKFKWSDGHESGIYSWQYLRRVCRCHACSATVI